MVPAVLTLVAAIVACPTPTRGGDPRPVPAAPAAVVDAAVPGREAGPTAVVEALPPFREEAEERAEGEDHGPSGRSRPASPRAEPWPVPPARPAGASAGPGPVAAAVPLFLLCGRLTC